MAATKRSLRQLAASIRRRLQAVRGNKLKAERYLAGAIHHARAVGTLLLTAKGELARQRKQRKDVPGFMDWVWENTLLRHRSATNYMRIAERWGDLARHLNNPSGLSIRHALYILHTGHPGPVHPWDGRNDLRDPDHGDPVLPAEYADYLDRQVVRIRKEARAAYLTAGMQTLAHCNEGVALLLSLSPAAQGALAVCVGNYADSLERVGTVFVEVAEETWRAKYRAKRELGLDDEAFWQMHVTDGFVQIERDAAKAMCRRLCRLAPMSQLERDVVAGWLPVGGRFLTPGDRGRLAEVIGPPTCGE